MRKERGITLIALIITIIIMLILAGVVINLTIGENGLFKIAKQAGKDYEIAAIKEQIITDVYDKQAQNEGDVSEDNLKEILEKYGKLSEEENLMDKTLTTSKGNHKIKVSDIFNGTTVKEEEKDPSTEEKAEEPTFTTMGNAPDRGGFNKETTYYVAWDLNESKTEYVLNEKKMSQNVAPSNWYDYTAGVNHWANIKTTGGGNDCYWVWIPRYAYCITEGYHTNVASTIDIKFLQGTTNTPIDGSSITISNSSGAGNWNVHPAFWFDKNNNGVEDEGEQLTGIWVAKFEASSDSPQVFENPTAEQLNTDGGSDLDTDLKVRVKPNVTSWRNITVNNIFTVCKNLTTTGNSLEGTTGIDSHMMKNTEWGAVAYLSMSIYGKNGEVWNNPYEKSNNSSITGLCSKEPNGKDSSTTDITKTCKYNEVGGGNASTTGNVYGVYDMAGGAVEYVAGIYRGGVSNENRSQLWNSNNLKYVDQYTETTGSQNTYFGNTVKYGDAVYETSRYGSSSYGWDSSYSGFIMFDNPVFERGGCGDDGSNAGVFEFYFNTGMAYTSHSFRPVMLNLES